MFDHVAAKYDVTNDVLSLGQDRYWRREVVRAVAAKPGQRVLDLAAGTGTSSLPFARAGAAVVSSDFSLGMLTEGRRRYPQLPFVAGDATTPAVRRRLLRCGHDLLRPAQRRRRRGRAGRDAPGDQAGRAAGRVRVQPPDVGAVPHRLRGVPDARPAAGRPDGVQRARRPTSTSPSRSARGPPSPSSPPRSPPSDGPGPPGATSPAGSSRCTGPPPGRRRLPAAETGGETVDPG